MADNKTLSGIAAAAQGELLDETLAHIRNSPVDRSILLSQLATYIGSKMNKNEVYANAIINGCMCVDQRNAGAAVVGVTSGEYVIDRFRHDHAGTMVYDVNQDNDVPSAEYQKSLKVTITTADTSIAASDRMSVSQHIEGHNFAPYVGKDAVLSFWVKSTLAGTYCASFRNSGNDRSYVHEFVLSASTWELVSFPLTFDYSGGTWDYTNGAGIKLSIALVTGADRQTTADVWQTGNFTATSNQVNFAESTHSFWMTDMKLNEGLIKYPYQPFAFQRTLRDCQRYYSFIDLKRYGVGMAASSVIGRMPIQLPQTMRTIPTLSTDASLPSTEMVIYTLGGAAQNVTSIALFAGNEIDYTISLAVALGLTAGNSLIFELTSNKRISFDAEL